MLLHFRQGLVQTQSPNFFKVTYPYVDLLVTNTNTMVTFADGNKDYLYTEQESVSQAWGPLTLGHNQWLYWDLDTRTGRRTFGITLIEPINSPLTPTNPVTDQHWFNTATNVMSVWTGSGWARRIRVFACKLSNGSVPISMSINSPAFTGTQVGIQTQAYTGHILFDATTHNAIRDSAGAFVTTEDQLSTAAISLSDVKLASIIVEGEAQQTMSSHTVVVFSDFGQIVHADHFTSERTRQFGMIETSAMIGQTVPVTNHGLITSDSWDWTSVGVNALLYCDALGSLTATPVIPNQPPVATVLDKRTIILGSPVTQSVVTTSGAVQLATQPGHGISRLSVPPAEPTDPVAVGDNDVRLVNARPPTTHVHTLSQITDAHTIGTITITQPLHGITDGTPVYHNGVAYAAASAANTVSANVVGIAFGSTTDTFVLHVHGILTGFAGLIAGSTYYLTDIPGEISITEPIIPGHVSKPLLVAISTTSAVFVNQRGIII